MIDLSYWAIKCYMETQLKFIEQLLLLVFLSFFLIIFFRERIRVSLIYWGKKKFFDQHFCQLLFSFWYYDELFSFSYAILITNRLDKESLRCLQIWPHRPTDLN